MGRIFFCLVLLTCFFHSRGQQAGQSCSVSGRPGVCKLLPSCNTALDDIKKKKFPQTCSYADDGFTPIVCCVGASSSPPPTPAPKPQQTTEYIPYDPSIDESEEEEPCPPVAPDITTPRTGQKAFDKCIEYQETYVYPCVKKASINGGKTRANRCHLKADKLIVGGEDAERGEFSHMALLGFGENLATAAWSCGGSVISDRFVLTAGHCTFDRFNGNVSYVAVGVYKRSEKWDPSQIHRVSRIIKHPEYKSPSVYNDIALIQLENRINLNQFLVPACVDVGNGIGVRSDKGVASGWGALTNKGQNSDTLQKVTLERYTIEECKDFYIETRTMADGYRENTQLCYGNHTHSKDSCQGDSGGPMQVRNSKISCMYTVVGITSTGYGCGILGEPGLYTRVSAFASWIESVVWP